MDTLASRRILFRFAILVVAGLMAGCSVLSPKPDFAHYYRLEPSLPKVSPAPASDPNLALAVFPADLPGALDRPQIVSDLGGGQVNPDEYHRWAESLDAMFARVLAQDIATLSNSAHVAAFPLSPGFDQEFEVWTQIYQFDGAPGGVVTLRAAWRITGPDGKPNYSVHETTFTRQAGATADPEDGYLDTLDKLVGDLAREITLALPEARAAKAARPQPAP